MSLFSTLLSSLCASLVPQTYLLYPELIISTALFKDYYSFFTTNLYAIPQYYLRRQLWLIFCATPQCLASVSSLLPSLLSSFLLPPFLVSP